MNNTRPLNLSTINNLNKALAVLQFKATNKKETYQWIEQLFRSVGWRKLKKKQRGQVRQFLRKMTGYSDTQLDRLIKRWTKTGQLKVSSYHRHSFSRRYTDSDIKLLAKTDDAHHCLSGPATRKILLDEFLLFKKPEFVRLQKISSAHIYNFRKTNRYRAVVTIYTKTKPTQVRIGERRKPEPMGQPGYLRVDSVHGGDSQNGQKGVYYINLVDEVLQWEVVICVAGISERYLKPALQTVLALLPFRVLNVHADNGSEYINHRVAKMLEKLRATLTKSRPRHHNDNALVESKNGSVVRKHLGYGYIKQEYASEINVWCLRWLTPYLNFHRPCAFGKEVIVNDKTGRRKRVYPHQDYMTPYEKLKSLTKAEQYLKTGISFARLDKIAYAQSHTDFARQMNRVKYALWKKINS